MSYGIILVRDINGILEYLVVSRKFSFGLLGFMYGDYDVNNTKNIIKQLKLMTSQEINNIFSLPFDELWNMTLGGMDTSIHKYHTEIYKISKAKYKKVVKIRLSKKFKPDFDINEICEAKFMSFDECIENIRPRHIDKKLALELVNEYIINFVHIIILFKLS